MYYPYFRGKQFELVLLREQAELIAGNEIYPIIEPVKENITSLKRTLQRLVECGVEFSIVANPQFGDLINQSDIIFGLIDEVVPSEYPGISVSCIVNQNTNIDELCEEIGTSSRSYFNIIHYGYTDGRELAEKVKESGKVYNHIFIEERTSKLYQRHFKEEGIRRILIRDGFRVMKNQDYPPSEHFSDLHITYTDENMNGFGDFLIVGDEYRETGGPAYAVAIHITYLNDEEDMYVKHFVSDQSGSPINPAGKFQEALTKLINELDREDTQLLETNACNEFRELHDVEHFPGLGFVKKLSMQHHLELIDYFLQ